MIWTCPFCSGEMKETEEGERTVLQCPRCSQRFEYSSMFIARFKKAVPDDGFASKVVPWPGKIEVFYQEGTFPSPDPPPK